jgi:hypothetical protein
MIVTVQQKMLVATVICVCIKQEQRVKREGAEYVLIRSAGGLISNIKALAVVFRMIGEMEDVSSLIFGFGQIGLTSSLCRSDNRTFNLA